MHIGVLIVCDLCFLPIASTEGITIHLETENKSVENHYHNRSPQDCLGQIIRELRDRYAPCLLLTSEGKSA